MALARVADAQAGAVSDDGQFPVGGPFVVGARLQRPPTWQNYGAGSDCSTAKRHVHTLAGDGPDRFRNRPQASSAPFPRVGESNRAG